MYFNFFKLNQIFNKKNNFLIFLFILVFIIKILKTTTNYLIYYIVL